MKKIIYTLALLSIITFQAQEFTGSFDLITEQTYKNGNIRVDSIHYTIDSIKTAMIIRAKGNQPDLRLIFNPVDSTITGLFEARGNKGGYILPMNETYWPAMHYGLQKHGTGPRTELNYTDEQKEINGVVCNEMICDSEKFEASLYIDPEIELSLVKVLAYQSVGAGEDTEAVTTLANCGVQGFAVESYIFDKKREANIKLSIKNLSNIVNDSVFNTEGFKLADARKEK